MTLKIFFIVCGLITVYLFKVLQLSLSSNKDNTGILRMVGIIYYLLMAFSLIKDIARYIIKI